MQEQQDEIRALWAALIVMALIVCGLGFLSLADPPEDGGQLAEGIASVVI